MRRAPFLSITILMACGHGDGGGSADGATLQEALDDARASLSALCTQLDGCYPDLVRANWCTHPTPGGSAGQQRNWPPAAADECWEPVYQQHPRTLLDFFSCIDEQNRAAASCYEGCPDAASLQPCVSAAAVAESACENSFIAAVGAPLAEEYEACEERLAPNPEDEE